MASCLSVSHSLSFILMGRVVEGGGHSKAILLEGVFQYMKELDPK